MKNFYFILSSLFLVSLFFIDNNYYIKNISNNSESNYILFKSIDYNFRMVIELIGVCVLNYFYLFKICYITSVNIIFKCVTYYFICFNNLFHACLYFIESCIINSYIYSYNLFYILATYPNNFLILFYALVRLYIKFRH